MQPYRARPHTAHAHTHTPAHARTHPDSHDPPRGVPPLTHPDQVLNAYKAMTTEEEDALLHSSPPSDRQTMNTIIISITSRLVKVIKEGFGKIGKKPPRQLGKQDIKISTMVDNLTASKIVIDKRLFAAWCAKQSTESGGGSSSSAPAPAPASVDADASDDETDVSDDADSGEEQQVRTTPRKTAQPGAEDSEASASDGLEASDYEQDGSDDGSARKRKRPRQPYDVMTCGAGTTPQKPVEIDD